MLRNRCLKSHRPFPYPQDVHNGRQRFYMDAHSPASLSCLMPSFRLGGKGTGPSFWAGTVWMGAGGADPLNVLDAPKHQRVARAAPVYRRKIAARRKTAVIAFSTSHHALAAELAGVEDLLAAWRRNRSPEVDLDPDNSKDRFIARRLPLRSGAPTDVPGLL